MVSRTVVRGQICTVAGVRGTAVRGTAVGGKVMPRVGRRDVDGSCVAVVAAEDSQEVQQNHACREDGGGDVHLLQKPGRSTLRSEPHCDQREEQGEHHEEGDPGTAHTSSFL